MCVFPHGGKCNRDCINEYTSIRGRGGGVRLSDYEHSTESVAKNSFNEPTATMILAWMENG